MVVKRQSNGSRQMVLDTVLILDDDPQTQRSMASSLEGQGYRCLMASTSSEAIQMLDSHEVSLILSDVTISQCSGIKLLSEVASRYRDTAMVMVTATDDPETARRAAELGAFGYVMKPLSPNALLVTVVNALARRELEIENRNRREELEARVSERTRELWQALTDLERTEALVRAREEETIQRLAAAAEFRDCETASHVRRMSLYSELIARAMGMDSQETYLLRVASAMHDVGKIGIRDEVLLKRGPLTPADVQEIRRHPEIGHAILAGSNSELLDQAAEIALTHHEHFDGGGYPSGLAGEEIPLVGRIAAVADAFDAMTTNRVYRPAFALVRAVEMIRNQRGRQFDPRVVDAFEDCLDRLFAAYEQTSDG